MSGSEIFPALQPSDVERAAQLIQQAYASNVHLSSEDQRRLQAELFEIQKRPEAWGLVVPFSEHSDQSVQFFGAHTIQVKITRDWDSFPQANAPQLRDFLLDLTAHSIILGRNKIVLRKFFVAITALAIKLAPTRPPVWPNWILSCVTLFSGRGVSTEHLLDFLAIVAEEVGTAEMLPAYKLSITDSISDAAPVVVQAITTSVNQRSTVPIDQLHSALKCLEAWMPHLPANDLTSVIPLLISLLEPSSSGPSPEFDESAFIPASDALQELMTHPPFSDGSGSKTLTEPLLLWLEKWGRLVVQMTLTNGFADGVSNSLCKLVVAFGEQSVSYFAANITSSATISGTSDTTKSHLVQIFLRILLSYTGLPGYSGVDEEESEMTLAFWYLFQEALWTADFHPGFFEEGGQPAVALEGEQANIINALYQELVQILRRKVAWPANNTWTKDQIDKFQIYRRDVGDTLINAYYILRKDLTSYYVNDIAQRLQTRQEYEGWEEIEATLHCIMAIQEAIPIEDNQDLSRLFSTEILGRLPTTGTDRVRRTTLVLIGSYASWFTTQSATVSSTASSPLMSAITCVVSALSDPSLCLPAANALRNLCDSNRIALAPHISAFGELHAGLTAIPDTERAKVLQSIASVIQALPPKDEIPPVETVVNPIVSRLFEALQLSNRLPEDARLLAIQQLQALTGIAKGLTRVSDSLLTMGGTPEAKAEAEELQRARDDPRIAKLREALLGGIKLTIDLWSTDASVGDALSDIIKAMTSLPSDMTLLSLPAGPLLELVSLAAQRQLTAVWLSLVSMLIIQLDPPTLLLPTTIKTTPNTEAQALVSHLLPVLLQTSLTFLGQPGAMEENPDIVQGFFSCMESFSQHFISMFHQLPPETFGALINCSVASLNLQERYSMVAGCSFIASIILKTFSDDKLAEAKTTLIERYGRRIMHGILCGLAGIAPRSVIPNLITLMLSLLTRCPAESRAWIREILYADDFLVTKAGPDAKEKFLSVVNSGRSTKKIKDAANQLALVARGMEASGFGYGASTM